MQGYPPGGNGNGQGGYPPGAPPPHGSPGYGVHPQAPQHGQPGYPNPYQAPLQQAPVHPHIDVGFFGTLPCPYCGAPTSTTRGGGQRAAQMAGGLVGALIYSAIAAKHYCPQHGEIKNNAFSPQLQNLILMRRLAKVFGALAIFAVVIAIIVAVNVAR